MSFPASDKQKKFLKQLIPSISWDELNDLSSFEAKKLIQENIDNKQGSVENASYKPTNAPQSPKFDQTTMYLSYAKDLCIACVEKTTKTMTESEIKDLFLGCVRVIKEGKKEWDKTN